MPSRPKGTTSAIFAITGNFIITILKFVGFLASNSSALFSETIHSFADTLNQSLLLLGIRRSRRKADEEFSYGYGNERFFWALISACGIFFLGAGITMYHGITALWHNEVPELNATTFVILVVAFVIESFTLYKAVQELRSHHPKYSFAKSLVEGDPVTIAVIYEDTVAVLGVIIALIGITLTEYTGNGVWDALGSIGISICLGVVAIVLISKNRGFLIGKSIPAATKRDIIKMLVAEPCIEKVIDFKSSVLDVGKYHIKCEVEWNGTPLLEEMFAQEDPKETFERVKGDYDEFNRHMAYTADLVPRLMGRTIDAIEKKIVAAFPQIEHIDIEIN
ncbi:MAG: cation diffusion facilitator family transporter [Parcubacteria group bacterium]|nr:cation diffusion facilitator family transporter [Parcubacteria group bacterium]